MKIKEVRIRAVGKFLAELRQGDYVDRGRAAAVICTDQPVADAALAGTPNCRAQFIDTEDIEDQRAFTRLQAREIGAFLKALPDEVSTLYCCCDWGQSRSAGLAAACMAAIGQDEQAVFRNSAYAPNLLVYAYMSEALGSGLPTAEQLEELKRLRTAATKSGSRNGKILKRIIVTGSMGEGAAYAAWPSALGKQHAVPLEDRRVSGWTVPYTEGELLADRQRLGHVLPGSLLILRCDIPALRAGTSLKDRRERLRKYCFWLKYMYQGTDLLLLFLPGPSQNAGAAAELAAVCRELSDELRISFLCPLQGDQTEDAPHFAKRLAEAVADLYKSGAAPGF